MPRVLTCSRTTCPGSAVTRNTAVVPAEPSPAPNPPPPSTPSPAPAPRTNATEPSRRILQPILLLADRHHLQRPLVLGMTALHMLRRLRAHKLADAAAAKIAVERPAPLPHPALPIQMDLRQRRCHRHARRLHPLRGIRQQQRSQHQRPSPHRHAPQASPRLPHQRRPSARSPWPHCARRTTAVSPFAIFSTARGSA